MTDMEKWWKEHWNEFLNDFRTLISIPSVSMEDPENRECPYGKPCVDVLEAVGEIVRRAGFDYSVDSNQYGLLVWKGRREETVGIFSHMDVVDRQTEDEKGVLCRKGKKVSENNRLTNAKSESFCNCACI